MNIGSTIKRRREKADLTRAQLAALAGMPRQQLYRLELGPSSPTLDTVSRIAAALKVSAWQLVKEAENGQ